MDIRAIDDDLGRRGGRLLALAKMDDVIDAALLAIAVDGDLILTSDPDDLEDLARSAGAHVELVSV